jgi:hypothetical protein
VAAHPHLRFAFEFKIFLEASDRGLASAKNLFAHLKRLRENGDPEEVKESDAPLSPPHTGIEIAQVAAASTFAAVSSIWGSFSKQMGLNSQIPPLKVEPDIEFDELMTTNETAFETLKRAAMSMDELLAVERKRYYELARVAYYLGQVAELGGHPPFDAMLKTGSGIIENIAATHQQSLKQLDNDVCIPLGYIGKYTSSLTAAEKQRSAVRAKLERAHVSVHQYRKKVDTTRARPGLGHDAVSAATRNFDEAEAFADSCRQELAELTNNQKDDMRHIQQMKHEQLRV